MKVRRFLKTFYYLGFNYKCVFCDLSFRKFDANGLSHEVLDRLEVIGGQRRDNSKCPICRSTDRERLLFFYYKRIIKPKTSAEKLKILHVAPEKNFKNILLKDKNILYFSGDKYEKGYETVYDCEYLDVTDLSYPNETFDMVICNHVLEHVSDYQVALSEIIRVLKPGGKAVLQVPIAAKLQCTIEDRTINNQELRELHYGQKDHVRLFGMDYARLLEQAGFTVEIFTSQFLSDNKVKKNGLNERENLFEVSKPFYSNSDKR